jgi:hypothetical protein
MNFQIRIVSNVKDRGHGVYASTHYHGVCFQGPRESTEILLGHLCSEGEFYRTTYTRGNSVSHPKAKYHHVLFSYIIITYDVYYYDLNSYHIN